jgi:hypothetical protein
MGRDPTRVFKKRCHGFTGRQRQHVRSVQVQQQPKPTPPLPEVDDEDKILRHQAGYDVYMDRKIVHEIVDVGVLSQILAGLLCGQCKEPGVKLEVTGRCGLASNFKLSCDNQGCGYKRDFNNFGTAQQFNVNGKSLNLYPVNLALVNAARLAGIGRDATKSFCSLMALRGPPDAWVDHQEVLHRFYKDKAEDSMDKARQEAKDHAVDTTGVSDLAASFDGSWMKRGFQSLAGFVSCIGMSNHKVLDVDALHKYCPTCKGNGACKKGDQCSINYRGTSGGMEPTGTVNIVKRFSERNLKITRFLGDGDSRAFKKASEAVDWPMVKLECVNHVAKRMGSRLLRRVKDKKGVVVGKKRGLGGAGRLTGKSIKRIQSYYNFIIHQCEGNPQQMREWTLAMYDHISSSNRYPKHGNCSVDYCKSLQADASGDVERYDHKDPSHLHIPRAVMRHVKDIFEDLANINLLEKVAHGKTQNANECFNSTVWNLLPKNGFANRMLVELGMYMAVCRFNDGQLPVLQILDSLGYPVGKDSAEMCKSSDQRRVYLRGKNKEYALKKRKRRETTDDENSDGELPDYAPGEYGLDAALL